MIRLRMSGRYACWTPVGARSERATATLPSHDAWCGLIRRVLGKAGCGFVIHRITLLSVPKREAMTSNEFKFNNVGLKPVFAHRGQHTQRTTVYIRNPDYLIELTPEVTDYARPGLDTVDKYHSMLTRRVQEGQQEGAPVFGITECPVRKIEVVQDKDVPRILRERGALEASKWNEDLSITFFGTDWAKGLNYFYPLEIRSGVLEYPTWREVIRKGIKSPLFGEAS